jgi:ADP-ribose pyrophosphatase YjhB (NUDIX family)
MSWRGKDRRVIEPSHKHNLYKNFGSYTKKYQKNHTQWGDNIDHGVYSGTHGFVQKKTLTLSKNDQYKHFNVKSTKMTLKQTRCGVIAFNEHMTKVLCVCNRTLYDKYGLEQWGLPKGHMEETDKVYSNCASREFFEETGVRYNIHQKEFVFKRINNTIYYPIIINETDDVKQVDDKEILKVEWKKLDDLMKEGVQTKHFNQDLKVFLHRYFHDVKKLAQRNNETASRK